MLPLSQRNFLAITVCTDYITCAFFCVKKARAFLHAYSRMPVVGSSAVLFNPTRVAAIISSFCKQHQIKNAFVGFAVDGQPVVDQVVIMPSASPQSADFIAQRPELKKMAWDSRYLYLHAEHQFAFYVVGMPRELVLQYNLMAQAQHLNVVTITTEFSALLQAYKRIEKSESSHMLAKYVTQQPLFSALLTPHTCVRAFDVAPGFPISVQEAPFMMKSFGLFCAGEIV